MVAIIQNLIKFSQEKKKILLSEKNSSKKILHEDRSNIIDLSLLTMKKTRCKNYKRFHVTRAI